MGLLPSTNESFNLASPSNNYFALLPFTKTTDSFDAKLDYNITDKDRLTGRFSFSRPVIFQAPLFGNAGGAAQGAFEGTGTQKTYVSRHQLRPHHFTDPGGRGAAGGLALSQRGAADRLRLQRRRRTWVSPA